MNQVGGEYNVVNTGYAKMLICDNECRLDITFQKHQDTFDNSVYPVEYFNALIKRYNSIRTTLGDDFFTAINFVYTYKYIKTIFTSKPVRGEDRYKEYFINKYKVSIEIDGVIIPNVLKYEFFDPLSLAIYEYYLNFGTLLKRNDNILLITVTPGYLEAVCYYYIMHFHKMKHKNIKILVPIYIFKNFISHGLERVTSYYKLDYEVIDKPLNTTTINELVAKQTKRYNYIHIDPHIYNQEIVYFRDQLNHQYLISLLCLSLQLLQSNGNLTIAISAISTAVTRQIVYYISKSFDTKYLYFTESSSGSYQSYLIYFFGYTEINKVDLNKMVELNDELYKIDPTGYKNYNIVDDDVRKRYNITKDLTGAYDRFLKSFAWYDDKLYDETIFNFNKRYLDTFDDLLNKLTDYIKNKDDKDYVKHFNDTAFQASVNLAKKLKLSVKPFIKDNLSKGKFIKNLNYLTKISDKVIKFKFDKEVTTNEDLKIDNRKRKLSPDLRKSKVMLKMAGNLIDTRDINKYDFVKKYVRYYEKTLGELLRKNYNISINGRIVSRAWIKMFEMLKKTKLITSLGDQINGFHICEAPGTFILATNYYIKNYTDKRYKWVAQSLRNSSIYDDYGLIKKFKDSWDFGDDMTGDITKLYNIEYYAKKYQNINYITADCGLSWGENDLTMKLKYCMIVLILKVLAVGGNFVFKTLLPIDEQLLISLYYLIYNNFEQMYFFKSTQNRWSPEFYVIGINYLRKINNETNNVLTKYIELGTYNKKINLFKQDNKYADFELQLDHITRKLSVSFQNAIFRNMYYLDNWDDISEEHKNDIKKSINMKNKKWVRRLKVKKLHDPNEMLDFN